MKKNQDIATFIFRIAISAGFLSAVASRLSLWGVHSSGWAGFLKYTAEVNSFLPTSMIPAVATISTILETSIGMMLLAGFKTRIASLASSLLTLMFAIAMTISFGVKEPLDYSVFAVSAGSFLLATAERYRWSMDEFLYSRSQS